MNQPTSAADMARQPFHLVSRPAFRARTRRLALCLSAALAPISGLHAAQTWTVQNCSDSAPNSLRAIIGDTANVQSGDTIDLSQLPALCGSVDSVITLSTGEITVSQDNLDLVGPDPSVGTVTISGGLASRVLHHFGFGTLGIFSLTIKDGSTQTVNYAYGGCIASNGSVLLNSARVADCTASSSMGFAAGGAISASYDVGIIASSVSGSKTIAPVLGGSGGGIHSTGLVSKYSSISNNVAYGGSSYPSIGGGAAVYGSTGIYHSTFDHNSSGRGGALMSNNTTRISNSTISKNESTNGTVAVSSPSLLTLEISNSTIAFNHASASSNTAAVVFSGSQPSDSLSMYSSIVANNTAGPNNVPADIYIASGHGTLSGADNLVIAANASPPAGVITITSDPMLGPLQLNGGTLLTHALLPGSPALGVGNHLASYPPTDANTNDQRGPGYPRTTGNGANETVDIGAVQFDTIFADGFD